MHGLEDSLASNEPAFLHRLVHPQIVPVREAQWDPVEDRAITFVMPLFEGGSVHSALLEGYAFSTTQAIRIAADALDALAYLHREHQALHRDTKPGNVVMDKDRKRGFLMDFGSAAAIQSDGAAEAVLGTNIYRAPEARITGRVGRAGDVFGIGMMLYEMVNGRIAWENMRLEAVEARLKAGRRALPDSQLVFGPHVNEPLRRCIRKSIHRDAGRRFATPDDFLRALRRIRSIDWRQVSANGDAIVWEGGWPPHVADAKRARYRVSTRLLAAGKKKGHVRVESDMKLPGGEWRQAVADRTLDPTGRDGLADVFKAVAARAAHRNPAR
jgi:serine/threonine-protein kinase